jgi:hypothetical protein
MISSGVGRRIGTELADWVRGALKVALFMALGLSDANWPCAPPFELAPDI